VVGDYMEFKDKLQNLRKQNSLTQEELANKLFVSRTAISKWETGKGYPNLESLQTISNLFKVSINDLLSCEELITLSSKEKRNLNLFYLTSIFVCFDLLVCFSMFLPLFGNEINGMIVAVNLPLYNDTTIFKTVYYSIFIGIGLFGLVEMFLFFVNKNLLVKIFYASIIYQLCGLFLFILSRQPYGGSVLFIFIIIKVFILLKKHQAV